MTNMMVLFQAPDTYSAESPAFNCVMRAHLNYLENYPSFATCMLVGGLQYPVSDLGHLAILSLQAY